MFTNLLTLIAFLTIITLLVAAHELGHYLFAKFFKMGVEEFSIGFGKPAFTYRRKVYDTPEGPEETAFTVRPLPLGGFVRIKGMVPQEDGSEVNIPGGFYSKPPSQRLWTLFGGPLFSVLAGLAILVPLFMISGAPKRSLDPIIGGVSPDGPAAKAGLREGDRLVSVDGKTVASFYEMVSIVRDRFDTPVKFVVARDGVQRAVEVVPVVMEESSPVLGPDLEPTDVYRKQGKIGLIPKTTNEKLGFVAALSKASMAPIEMVKSLYGVATLKRKAADELGGPLTMINATKATVESGFASVVALAGILSISLGIFNLIPIPMILDGGQMAVAFAELLRGGRRVSMRVQERLMTLGAAMLLVLIVGVFFVDIKRFFMQPKPAVSTPQK